jgi:hypothetical protein
MYWGAEVEVDWLVDTLRDGRFNGLAWISVERWQVKEITLQIR